MTDAAVPAKEKKRKAYARAEAPYRRYGHASAAAEALDLRSTYPLSRATPNSGGILLQGNLQCNNFFTVGQLLFGPDEMAARFGNLLTTAAEGAFKGLVTRYIQINQGSSGHVEFQPVATAVD